MTLKRIQDTHTHTPLVTQCIDGWSKEFTSCHMSPPAQPACTHTHTYTNTLYGKTKQNTCAQTVTHAWHSAGSLTRKHESLKLFAADRWSEAAPRTHLTHTHSCARLHSHSPVTPPTFDLELKGVVVWRCGLILCVWSHFLPESPRGAKVAAWGDLKMGAQWGAWMWPVGATKYCVRNTYMYDTVVIFAQISQCGQTPH